MPSDRQNERNLTYKKPLKRITHAKQMYSFVTATAAGFTLIPSNRHACQGTAHRAIIFKENYLEFVFMDTLSDAQKNPLRLDRRADWSNTGASPFGICLRGEISENESSEFWAYRPPYWPKEVVFSEAERLQIQVTVDGTVANKIFLNNLLSIRGVQ